ncbi:MAG: TraR/DksA family transcriptional regulator [Gammaproteobacteria bacterium]|nr:TraR/DksA family transcriptional regulator [Gammaproteobacteria bacterium]
MADDDATAAARLKELLDELQGVAAAAADAAGVVELDQSRVGRLSRMDAMQAQQVSKETNRRRELQITRIKAALLRIDAGEYGLCVSCGEAIDPRRLALDPAAPLCIACAEAADGTRRG